MILTGPQVKFHLRRPDLADDDADLAQVMAAAELAILGYINTTEYWRGITVAWTDRTSTPLDVQHAMLLKTAELYRFRGDDLADEGPALDDASDMSPAIVRLLRRWRDPVLVATTNES